MGKNKLLPSRVASLLQCMGSLFLPIIALTEEQRKGKVQVVFNLYIFTLCEFGIMRGKNLVIFFTLYELFRIIRC